MSDGALELALRETRRQIVHPAYVPACLGIGALMALVGAFGSDQVLGLVGRFAYWLAITVLTSAVGIFCGLAFTPALQRRKVHFIAIILIVGLASAVPILLAVLLVSLVAFGIPTSDDFLTLIPQVLGVTMVISTALAIIERTQAAPPTAATSAKSPAILARLPLHKRGRLLSLSVSDHYTEVETTTGREMLLMRLGDAIGETGPEAGLQVHRSHWVAIAAISQVKRAGDGALITLTSGRDIPVSRSNVAALRDKGLLP